jgi:AbrB family looped-hinge helix DNA binding protein
VAQRFTDGGRGGGDEPKALGEKFREARGFRGVRRPAGQVTTVLNGLASECNLISKTEEGAMSETATTRLSSRGQVVIPEEIRTRLGLRAGTQFVIIAEGDTVIFKVLQPPPFGEFKALLSRAQKAARKAGMKPSDIEAAIKKVRERR